MRILGLAILAMTLGCGRETPARSPDARSDAGVTPPPPAAPAEKPDLIRLDTPLPNAVVSSPLSIQGAARGPWFFEASFPVYLLNAAGDTIAVIPAQAQGEWMTRDFVPFTATLIFTPPASAAGTLVLAKDNPSGLAEHADELRVPIRFR